MNSAHAMISRVCLALAVAMAPASAFAVDPSYKKLGLSLGGGGALGFVHVGVIKVLEELGLPVDMVAGTSMGGIIGGLYAVGYSSAEIEEIVNNIDWSQLFFDEIPRISLSFRDRESRVLYLSQLHFNRNGVVMPAGILAGEKVMNLFSLLTVQYSDITAFNDFLRPYRCIATDIITGKKVVLDHGSLPLAMRATMAIPGVFTPAEIEGRLLVDGGLTENLPVDTVKDMGADFVIAVDIRKSPRTAEQLAGLPEIIDQTMTILLDQNIDPQRRLADLLIQPELAAWTPASFDMASALIKAGEEAARKKTPELLHLRELARRNRPPDNGQGIQSAKNRGKLKIDSYKVIGARFDDEALVRKVIDLVPTGLVAMDDIQAVVGKLYDTGHYAFIEYSLKREGRDKHVLEIALRPRAKIDNAEVNNSVNVGLSSENRFGVPADGKVVLAGNLTLYDISGPQSFWSIDGWLVDRRGVSSEYFQPIGDLVFIVPGAFYVEDRMIVSTGDSTESYDFKRYGAKLGLLAYIWFLGQVHAGYKWQRAGSEAVYSSNPSFPAEYVNDASLFIEFKLDTLDHFPFPRKGVFFKSVYSLAEPAFGGNSRYRTAEGDFRGWLAASDRISLGLRLRAATAFDSQLATWNAFLLGGRDGIDGSATNSLIGDHLLMGALELSLQVPGLGGILKNILFLRLRASAGKVWRSGFAAGLDLKAFHYGGGLGIGLNTGVGSVNLDGGFGDEGKPAVFLGIGSGF